MGIPITADARRCPARHNPLVRRPNESPSYFKRRKYCDEYCAQKHQNRARVQRAMDQIPPRYCRDCKSLLVRRPGERLDVFRKRVGCLKPPCPSIRHQAIAKQRWQ